MFFFDEIVVYLTGYIKSDAFDQLNWVSHLHIFLWLVFEEKRKGKS